MNDANNVDVSVYQGEAKQKSCGTLQRSIDRLDQAGQIYTLVCNNEGDAVKLSKDTVNAIVVSEVVVTSTGIRLINYQFKNCFFSNLIMK